MSRSNIENDENHNCNNCNILNIYNVYVATAAAAAATNQNSETAPKMIPNLKNFPNRLADNWKLTTKKAMNFRPPLYTYNLKLVTCHYSTNVGFSSTGRGRLADA